LHPDSWGGAWIIAPDPLDFRRYGVINIYEDQNAYYNDTGFVKTPLLSGHTNGGDIDSTMQQDNQWEHAQGTPGRGQLGVWDLGNALFPPVGLDGYPIDMEQRNW
jgi:hypothetical protein